MAKHNTLISILPGWLLMTGIAVFALFLSQRVMVGNRYPLESVTLALLTGLLIRNFISLPAFFNPGVLKYETLLKLGIVFLGMGLSFYAILEIGLKAVMVVALCLLMTPLFFFSIGRRAGLSQKMNILIGIGTTICGSTAIAITAPVIEAEEKDVSYAIGTISLFGLAAMFFFPMVGKFLDLSHSIFGLWAGTAIHATPQVVAAGYMYGETAGQVATVAKLTRNIFMAPAVFLIGLAYMKKRVERGENPSPKIQYSKALPLFLYGFIALAIVRTIGDGTDFIPASHWRGMVNHIHESGKFLILIAMAGIGLTTRLNAMRQIGARPFVVGLMASILLATLSLLLIQLLNFS